MPPRPTPDRARSRPGASAALSPPACWGRTPREGQFLPFTIITHPRRLGYELGDEEARANLTLHFRVESGGGRVLAETFHLFNHTYPRDLWEASQVEPVQIHGWAELPPGEYRLVAYLRNLSTGEGDESSGEWIVVGL